jgi:transcriptional regulator GlxA family with amidase domain
MLYIIGKISYINGNSIRKKSMLSPSLDRLEIDILVLPETTLMLFSSVIEPLRVANRISGRDMFSWRILSPDGAPVMTASRIPLPVHGSLADGRSLNPLFVVASYQWQKSVTPALKTGLSRAGRERPYLVGVESGTWVLAEAGLLNAARVTMHWEDREEFAARFPHVALVNARFVIDGKRITTGGSLPTLDLMLDIIRRRHGYSLALEVSRLFIYETEGSSAAPNDRPSVNALLNLDPRVRSVVRQMEETVADPVPVERLAQRAGISPRHLQSLFSADFGVRPHVHYLALRLNAARRQVIETSKSFTDIASATGFNSASAFARSYRAQFGESPSETRKRVLPIVP